MGTFNLIAQPAYLSEPDGSSIYSWGYGCSTAPASANFLPNVGMTGQGCSGMQVPGPTLIVTEGQPVTVTLTNNLPNGAGNTSILFPGFDVHTSGGVAGLLTQEAAPGKTVTYTFTPASPGTRAYYSGTQSDLQVEMGLYGVVIVLPDPAKGVPTCPFHSNYAGIDNTGGKLQMDGEKDFRLSGTGAAYHNDASCYDREYLFQFSEIDPDIHSRAEAQVGACAQKTGCLLTVATEP